MKKTTSAFIAMLITISLTILSACNSTDPPIQPGEGISSPTEDNSFDESVPEESSEPPIETDVSANMSDPVDIPPLGTPSKLIPIVEFGFGDGDYELGYSKPDEYGFIFGPNCLSVNGNDILINDCINRRLLVYRDGKLIDKVDTGDYPFTFNCALTDDYYYVVDEFGSVAYRIDRQTKEFEEIDFDAHDCSKDNDYTWSFKFEKNEGKIYIRARYRGDDVSCYLIDGATAPAATFPLNSSTVSYTNDNYILNEGNSESKELDLIPQVNGISAITSVISRKNGSASIIYQNMKYRDAEKNLSYYYVYYKLSSDGTVIGRYIQFVSNDSYNPPYSFTLNSALFREAVTDSGDLLVVNGDEDSVGIYKVEFGMDEIPFDVSDSVPEESSEPPIETDVSANMSDPVDIPPLGTPSKLIPIVEFGFGDGDYELGYSEPDEYGFTTGPNSLAVNGNEILINDCVNHRLLVYRDGELIDKIDISEYQHAFNCAFTNDYYYIIDDLGSVAYRIDRQTKEFEEIDFEAHDCSQDNDYTWSFKFVKVEGEIYIRGHHTGDDDVCYLIDGVKAPAATFPLNDSTVSYTNDKYILNEGNSQKKTLELIEQKNGIYTSTGVIAHKDGAASIIFQSMTYHDAEKNHSYYHVYYKLSSDGTVIGRYIQFASDDSYLPPYCATLNFYKFEEVITDSGDLLVVNGNEDSVGIYKVEFGMDEIPFDVSDSVPEESSEPPIETDVSANMSDPVDIPPLGTPSKLIPIVEFGFGDGDYELGYSKPDEYGFTTGPNSLAVNGNEILINDCVNHRLLVYRDGELIDKVDISEYKTGLMCEITDDYYYILDRFGSYAYRIDRKTKEFVQIEFDSKDNDYSWSFRFETFGDDLYIYGFNSDDETVCNRIDGVKASAASLPEKPTISSSGNNYTLNTCNGQQKTLDLAYETSQLHVLTAVKTNKDSTTSFIHQTLKQKIANNSIAYLNAYYKYSANGTVIGRYIQPMWDSSYKPLWSTSFGYDDFKMAITDSGDLLVVNGDEDSVGIYKVEFGMDELPFDASGETIETQGAVKKQT